MNVFGTWINALIPRSYAEFCKTRMLASLASSFLI